MDLLNIWERKQDERGGGEDDMQVTGRTQTTGSLQRGHRGAGPVLFNLQ